MRGIQYRRGFTAALHLLSVAVSASRRLSTRLSGMHCPRDYPYIISARACASLVSMSSDGPMVELIEILRKY